MGLMDMLKTSDPMEKFYAAAEKSNVPQGGITGKLFSAMFPHGLGNLAFGRSPEPMPPLETPEGTALMADLASNMMVPGTFIGPKGLARLFGDDAAKGIIATAENKLAQGVPKEAVFQELGVFKGPEGKWRYEIDDSGAALKFKNGRYLSEPIEENSAGFFTGMDVANALDHSALYSAYPETAADSLTIKSYGPRGHGQFNSLGDRGYIAMDGAIHPSPKFKADPDSPFGITAEDAARLTAEEQALGTHRITDPEGFKSTLLHELQHAVQEREGFARGGSPDMAFRDKRMWGKDGAEGSDIAFKMLKEKLKEMSSPQPIEDYARAAWGSDNITPEIERAYKEYAKGFKSGAFITPAVESAAQKTVAQDWYKRLAGEAESRAVQDRMLMNMDERRANFPEYAARNDLIIRGLMSGGK